MKKKNGGKGSKGSWKADLLLCLVGYVALEYVPGVADSALTIGIVLIIGWLTLKLFRGRSGGGSRARRESAPRRMGRSAGSAFYDGAMGWLNGKPKTQWEQDIDARNEARKKYAWHEQQAKKFAGTSDEAWHKQRMKELYNKIR